MSRYSDVVALSSNHDRSAFDCGEPVLNDYLRRVARQSQKKDLARTYVVTRQGDDSIVGFFTLVAAEVAQDAAPAALLKGAGHHGIPVVVLARLAVDQAEQRQGLGRALLKDALQRTLAAADVVGVRAVLVHAKSPEVARWYAQFGFEPSPTDELHLFLSMSVLRASAT